MFMFLQGNLKFCKVSSRTGLLYNVDKQCISFCRPSYNFVKCPAGLLDCT